MLRFLREEGFGRLPFNTAVVLISVLAVSCIAVAFGLIWVLLLPLLLKAPAASGLAIIAFLPLPSPY